MSKSLFDSIRDRLHAKAGIVTLNPNPPSFKELSRTEWSPEFERLMRNRMMMGALRYGTLAKKRLIASKWDIIGPITVKVGLYLKTGNTEYLVDAANYCMIVFECHRHPNKHFHALDDHHDHCKEVKPNLHPTRKH